MRLGPTSGVSALVLARSLSPARCVLHSASYPASRCAHNLSSVAVQPARSNMPLGSNPALLRNSASAALALPLASAAGSATASAARWRRLLMLFAKVTIPSYGAMSKGLPFSLREAR